MRCAYSIPNAVFEETSREANASSEATETETTNQKLRATKQTQPHQIGLIGPQNKKCVQAKARHQNQRNQSDWFECGFQFPNRHLRRQNCFSSIVSRCILNPCWWVYQPSKLRHLISHRVPTCLEGKHNYLN